MIPIFGCLEITLTGLRCVKIIPCLTPTIKTIDVRSRGRGMLFHDHLIEIAQRLLLLPDFVVKLVYLTVYAVHSVIVDVFAHIIVRVIKWSEVAEVEQVAHFVVREALTITIGIDLALLFFDAVLVRRFHVHLATIVLLMLLKITVMGRLILVPLRTVVHVASVAALLGSLVVLVGE